MEIIGKYEGNNMEIYGNNKESREVIGKYMEIIGK